MTSLRSMSARSMVVKVLRKAPAILGCLLFMFSVITPFIFTACVPPMVAIYYWSYRSDVMGSGAVGLPRPHSYWFLSNWYYESLRGFVAIPWIPVLMFAFQALTLVFCAASIVVNRRFLSFAPVLLSVAVLALMICMGEMSHYVYVYLEYQQGYYLVYPSILLFTFAFIQNELARTKGTDETGLKDSFRNGDEKPVQSMKSLIYSRHDRPERLQNVHSTSRKYHGFYHVLLGLLLGLLLNLAIPDLHILPFIYLSGLLLLFMIVSLAYLLRSLRNEGNRIFREVRLLFLGICLISFAFGIVYFGLYIFGSSWLVLWDGRIGIPFGGVHFVSIMTSFSLYCCFSVMERLLQVKGKSGF